MLNAPASLRIVPSLVSSTSLLAILIGVSLSVSRARSSVCVLLLLFRKRASCNRCEAGKAKIFCRDLFILPESRQHARKSTLKPNITGLKDGTELQLTHVRLGML